MPIAFGAVQIHETAEEIVKHVAEHEIEEDDSESDEDKQRVSNRKKTIVMGRAKNKPTEGLGTQYQNVIDKMSTRTPKHYLDLIQSTADVSPVLRAAGSSRIPVGMKKKLQSFALPGYQGWQGADISLFDYEEFGPEVQRQVLAELHLCRPEHIDSLPGFSDASRKVTIVRAYYNQCLHCNRIRPVDLFPTKGFTCVDCSMDQGRKYRVYTM